MLLLLLLISTIVKRYCGIIFMVIMVNNVIINEELSDMLGCLYGAMYAILIVD